MAPQLFCRLSVPSQICSDHRNFEFRNLTPTHKTMIASSLVVLLALVIPLSLALTLPFKKSNNFFYTLSSPHSPIMGTSTALEASVLPDQQEVEEQREENTNSGVERGKKLRKKLKKGKKEKAIAWKKALDKFSSQVLDPCYLNYPIRSSTVEAAAQYPTAGPSPSSHGEHGGDGINDANKNDGEGIPVTAGNGMLMPGTHKHLGGAYDPTDGCIYGVPANSRAVLCLYPVYAENASGEEGGDNRVVVEYKMTTIPLPNSHTESRFKWLRGIFAHGYLWAIPSWSDAVLCVDVDAFWGRRPKAASGEIVNLLSLPSGHEASTWQWHGAGINEEKTAIYCIPSNAKAVLKVDLMTKTTSLIPIDVDQKKYPVFDIATTNKWYGGIRGNDNCVYGIPYRTCAVLRIDCNTNTAKLVGPCYETGQYNWHGGICIPSNGKIYAHPSHAETVLVIDTNPNNNTAAEGYNPCSELPIHRATYDSDPRKNYKWLGGAVGADGNIYCPACDTSAVLKINVTTDECTTFGFSGTLKNKWQGGLLSPRDGCIYCIPADGHSVLRIATSPNLPEGGENPVQLLGDLSKHKDKWQGGHLGKDGCLYFIPENGYRVLKVTPPNQPPQIVDSKLPEGDVKLELM